MRRLRIATPVQLSLIPPDTRACESPWVGLPETARVQVLALLATLIARGVVADEEPAS